jgi:hypothetical protein
MIPYLSILLKANICHNWNIDINFKTINDNHLVFLNKHTWKKEENSYELPVHLLQVV